MLSHAVVELSPELITPNRRAYRYESVGRVEKFWYNAAIQPE
jgi:hypothetical protein